jgi:hypothetical protein
VTGKIIVQPISLSVKQRQAYAADYISAMAYVDSRFETIDGIPWSRAETGEFYLTVVSGGIKPEGVPHPITCSTPELAIKYWLEAFKEYASDKSGKLYWRERPEVNGWEYLRGFRGQEALIVERHWVVYSRLLISDKPVLAKDDPRVKSYYDDMVEQAVA